MISDDLEVAVVSQGETPEVVCEEKVGLLFFVFSRVASRPP
jgi:hypothetical protein